MFPADRLPVPVYIWYTSRGKRVRKWFANGMGREARAFYARRMKQGREPRVVRADGEPTLFPLEGE